MTRLRRPVAAGALVVAVGLGWLRLGPLPDGLLDDRRTSTLVTDRHGIPLYEARAGDGTRQMTLEADALPLTLVRATIAAEDRRFRLHPGVDPLAIVRAVVHDLRAGRVVEGGSTITQQVAKLLLARRARRAGGDAAASRRRGLGAKLQETIVALRLEHRFDKNEILALYLNLAPYGNQIVGAERASHAYFGCPTRMLTVAQAAFLASLPQRPARFNPYRDPTAVSARQRRVIETMHAVGSISAAEVRDARTERLHLRRETTVFTAQHFVEMVLASVGDDRPARIETTLDAGLQETIHGVIRAERAELDRHDAHNVAVVVLDNRTGEWLAWEGSGDYGDQAHGGAINGPLVPRQPGSALKPFTYALAFDRGYSPASVLPDIPASFPTAEPGVAYTPRNYDGQFRGPMLARRALAGSENVPAVALASELGVAELVGFLREAGFSTLDKTAAHYGLGVTLGNAEVTLADLVVAYAAFARSGLAVRPTMVRRAGRHDRPDGSAVRLVSPRAAFWITDILSDPLAREYAFGRGGSLEFPFPVAAKTGTSQAYHDNWVVGYTGEVTVGVWVGNFDRTPLAGSSGVTGAGPIFHAVMLAAERRVMGRLPGPEEATLPSPTGDVVRRSICVLSGHPAGRWCPVRTHEWVPVDDPASPCEWHVPGGDGVVVAWPAAYRVWARARGLAPDAAPDVRLAVGRVVAGGAADVRGEPVVASLAIVNPPRDAIYLFDRSLRREFQTVPLRARADGGSGWIEWFVDEVAVGTSPSDAPFDWPLAPGAHVIRARDARGRAVETRIVVK